MKKGRPDLNQPQPSWQQQPPHGMPIAQSQSPFANQSWYSNVQHSNPYGQPDLSRRNDALDPYRGYAPPHTQQPPLHHQQQHPATIPPLSVTQQPPQHQQHAPQQQPPHLQHAQHQQHNQQSHQQNQQQQQQQPQPPPQSHHQQQPQQQQPPPLQQSAPGPISAPAPARQRKRPAPSAAATTQPPAAIVQTTQTPILPPTIPVQVQAGPTSVTPAAPLTPTVKADEAQPSPAGPPAKKSRTNTPWTPAEELRLKQLRDAGSSWAEIAKTFPTRTEGSVKKHWYKDMHYAEFAEDESTALANAIKEYESNKWKSIGAKVGKPAKACEQYAKEHFPEMFATVKTR